MRLNRLVISAALGLVVLANTTVVAASDDPPDTVQTKTGPTATSRPKLLPVLYASYGALQLGDVVTTTKVLRLGGSEGNPLMRPFAGSPVRLTLVKASLTALMIYGAEKQWRRGNRAGAIAALVSASAMMSIVVANNMNRYAQMKR